MSDLMGFYLVGAISLLALAIFAFIARDGKKKRK